MPSFLKQNVSVKISGKVRFMVIFAENRDNFGCSQLGLASACHVEQDSALLLEFIVSYCLYLLSCRLAANFQDDCKGIITVGQLQDAFLSEVSIENHQERFGDKQLGRFIKQMFPNVIRRQKTTFIDGTKRRFWGYCLTRHSNYVGVKSNGIPITEIALALIQRKPNCEWRGGLVTGNQFEIFKDTDCTINGERVFLSLTIAENRSYHSDPECQNNVRKGKMSRKIKF